MSALVIYEETEEIIYFPGGLPRPDNYPTYTYGYKIEQGTWYRIHMKPFGSGRGNFWIEIDPDNNEDGPVPKTIRALVLIAGG